MWFQSPRIAPFEQGERKAFKRPRPEGRKEEGEMKEICPGAATAAGGGGGGGAGGPFRALGLLSRSPGDF